MLMFGSHFQQKTYQKQITKRLHKLRMFHLILATLLFLQALQGTKAFAGISTPSKRTTAASRQKARTMSLPLSAVPSSNGMTMVLPPPVSISLGPFEYSWYEDIGNAGLQRKVEYSREHADENDPLRLVDATFAPHRPAKLHPFDETPAIPETNLYSQTRKPKTRLGRGLARVRLWLHHKTTI